MNSDLLFSRRTFSSPDRCGSLFLRFLYSIESNLAELTVIFGFHEMDSFGLNAWLTLDVYYPTPHGV